MSSEKNNNKLTNKDTYRKRCPFTEIRLSYINNTLNVNLGKKKDEHFQMLTRMTF